MNESRESQIHVLDAKTSDAIHGGPNFSLRHRLLRGVWTLVWLTLAAWTPPPAHRWRCFLLRLFGAKIGRGARVWGSTRVWYPPNLVMGDYAVLGWKTNCYCQDEVILEDYAMVSQHVHLVTGSHDVDDPSFQLITKPIRIRRYAWVASCAFIGPGVTVEEGAVLGGCGVTFRDLEPWTIYGGNPARVLRKRRNFDMTSDG